MVIISRRKTFKKERKAEGRGKSWEEVRDERGERNEAKGRKAKTSKKNSAREKV